MDWCREIREGQFVQDLPDGTIRSVEELKHPCKFFNAKRKGWNFATMDFADHMDRAPGHSLNIVNLPKI